MEELLCEDFNLDIHFSWKVYNFKYKQATIYETVEFMKNKDLMEWLYNFLKKHSTKDSFTKVIFIQSNKWYKDYIKKIEETFFRGAFEKISVDDKEKEKKDNTNEHDKFWSYLMDLSKWLWVEPLKLMKKYTFQQANYLYFRAVYNSNRWTKEWDELNRNMLLNKKLKDLNSNLEEKKELDNLFKKLNNLDTKK